MVARLIAVVAALVITGAPVVTTACEGICAERAKNAGTTEEHHSCHHETSPANEIAISSGAHLCGHSDDSPGAIAQSLSPFAGPAIIVVTFELAPPTGGKAPAAVAQGHGPPLVSSRSTQLRI